MPEGDAPSVDQPAPSRRRLESPPQPGREGRAGCMAWGAVLGIIFGIMVGLYALPPILKSIYGVEQVRYGEAYEDGGRTLRVLSVTQTPREPAGAVEVAIAPASVEPWQINADDFEIELTDGERLELLGSGGVGAIIDVGSAEQFLLTFPRLPGQDAAPAYLHLSSPRVRFDLAPEGAP